MINVQGPFSRIRYVDINLDSPEQIKDYLLQLGWKPLRYNYKKDGKKLVRDSKGKLISTSPCLPKGEEEFEALERDIGGNEIGKLIARRYVLRHRKSILVNDDDEDKGWLGLVRSDGRLGAQCVPQATNTGRGRHKVVVNVPKAKEKIPFGIELRSCLTVPSDKVLVGTDAAQLEARMEAHYCYSFTGGKEYAAELIDGDTHSKNAILFETDRDGAKSPKYALVYGCQPPKLASTLGCSIKKAERLWNNFWNGNTALKECRDHYTEEYVKNGYVVGLDGRKIYIRSKHSIINAVFQSAGSIVVKTAMCYLFNKWVVQKMLKAKLVLFQHDEFQTEVDKKDVDLFKTLADLSFVKAGEFYTLNVPLKGESKDGKNWAETH